MWGLGPRENADSLHSGTHPRFQGSTRDQDQDQTPEHILVLGLYSRSRSNSGTHPRFRALLKIEIQLQNTSSFLGLYSRLRSGTHPFFQGCTRDQDRDRTPEHILVFRALLKIEIEIEIEPVHGRGTLCTSPTMQKNCMGRGHQQTHGRTSRLLDQLRPEGRVGENLSLLSTQNVFYYVGVFRTFTCLFCDNFEDCTN